eukprot:UN23557
MLDRDDDSSEEPLENQPLPPEPPPPELATILTKNDMKELMQKRKEVSEVEKIGEFETDDTENADSSYILENYFWKDLQKAEIEGEPLPHHLEYYISNSNINELKRPTITHENRLPTQKILLVLYLTFPGVYVNVEWFRKLYKPWFGNVVFYADYNWCFAKTKLRPCIGNP